MTPRRAKSFSGSPTVRAEVRAVSARSIRSLSSLPADLFQSRAVGSVAGIWLLQKGRNQDPEGIAPKVLAAIPPGSDVMTALHAADFQPLNELGRVKALLPNHSHLSARRLP